MLSLKASKSPRPCGSQKTELNIAGLESSDYNRPFICPIWIHLKSPPIYSLSVLCNQLQNFHFTRQNFFWHSVKPAYQAQFFFFFFTWNYTQEGTRLRVLKQFPFCANAYTGSIQPCFLCMCFHTSEQKTCGKS